MKLNSSIKSKYLYLDVSANITEEGLASLFQSVQGFGFVDITRSKDCAGYKWTTKWLTGGDKPSLTVILFI